MLLQCYNKAASASLGAAGELLIAVSPLVREKREEILLVLVRKILSYSVVILSMWILFLRSVTSPGCHSESVVSRHCFFQFTFVFQLCLKRS